MPNLSKSYNQTVTVNSTTPASFLKTDAPANYTRVVTGINIKAWSTSGIGFVTSKTLTIKYGTLTIYVLDVQNLQNYAFDEMNIFLRNATDFENLNFETNITSAEGGVNVTVTYVDKGDVYSIEPLVMQKAPNSSGARLCSTTPPTSPVKTFVLRSAFIYNTLPVSGSVSIAKDATSTYIQSQYYVVPTVAGGGTVALTNENIVFRRLGAGGTDDIPRANVTNTSNILAFGWVFTDL